MFYETGFELYFSRRRSAGKLKAYTCVETDKRRDCPHFSQTLAQRGGTSPQLFLGLHFYSRHYFSSSARGESTTACCGPTRAPARSMTTFVLLCLAPNAVSSGTSHSFFTALVRKKKPFVKQKISREWVPHNFGYCYLPPPISFFFPVPRSHSWVLVHKYGR